MLRFLGVPESLHRDNPGRKMDEVVAAKTPMFSGPTLIQLGMLVCEPIQEVDQAGPRYPEAPCSEADVVVGRRCRSGTRTRGICGRLPLHTGCMCLGFALQAVHGCFSPVAERVFLESIVGIG